MDLPRWESHSRQAATHAWQPMQRPGSMKSVVPIIGEAPFWQAWSNGRGR